MDPKQPYLIDEDDTLDTFDLSKSCATRAQREAVIEGGYQFLRENGYPILPRYIPLCNSYIDGTINFEQLSRAIMAPDLH